MTRTLCIFVFMFLFNLNAAATTLDYDYSRIEKIILDAPESAGVSMDSLVQYIRDHAQGDEEKAYAVYLWLITNVAYDYEMKDKIVYGGMNIWTEHKGLDFWVDGAFENRKAICGSFSYIYLRIAQELGLTVASIPGWMTNFKSEEQRRHYRSVFKGRGNHRWNAVKLQDRWHYVDCAIQIWCRTPEEMIQTHFPINPFWQLTDKPVHPQPDMGDPTIYPAGETMGIRIIEPTSYIVNTGDTFTYTVTFPKKETVYGVFLWGVFSQTQEIVSQTWNGTTCTFEHDLSGKSKLEEYWFCITTAKEPLLYVCVVKI